MSSQISNRVLSVLGCLVLSLAFCQSAEALQVKMREWKDATGKFEIKANFVRVDGDNVVLEKEDGKTVEVPIEKLCAVDQGFIQGLIASGAANNMEAEEENPFADPGTTKKPKSPKKPDNSPSGSSSNKDSSEKYETIEVDFEDCPETSIAIGSWDVKVSPPSELDYALKPITLPGKSDFFEKLERTAFNPVARKAVLTYHLRGRGRNSESSTRLLVVDLQKNSVLKNVSMIGTWDAMAIDDAGEKIVLRKGGSDDEKIELVTARINKKRVEMLDEWVPYATMSEPNKEKMVQHAHFINNGHLFTLSQSGRAVIWDFENRKPVRQFRYQGACQPTLSQDRSQLVICGGDIVGVVNLDDDSISPSVKAAPQMNYWSSSALSPSGKHFAATTMSKLMVWDLESGDVLYEGKIPGMQTNGEVRFPHEDYVIVNNDKLFDYKNRIKVWHYQGARIDQFAGQTILTVAAKDQGKMIPQQLPHEEAMTWLKRAQEDSDLFVLKKDADVNIDVSGVSAKYRGDVEQSLKENIERMGFNYSKSADVVLKARIEGPTNEAVRYHFAGNFVIRQFNSFLSINYSDESIWRSRGSNVPGSVSGDSSAEIKQELEKAGRSPNTRFFATVRLPEYLQKPGEGSGRAGNAQTLGSSRVTVNGLEK